MIGRKKEAKELNRIYNRNEAELVAIYGRRRIGKTYLVDEVFGDKITFRHSGISPVDEDGGDLLRKQLKHFYNSLMLHGMGKTKPPADWLDAFFMLEKLLQSKDDGSRQLVFIDEMPWLDTPKSGFLTAFEAFWNTWGCHRKNLMVIVCGSANSWIQDRLINNHGGLYNRITYQLKLEQFTLCECEEFYKEKNIAFSRYDIVQSYMTLGGVPYYMGYVNPTMSFAQNIDNLFFRKNGILIDEYNRLFTSAFANPEAVKTIIELLYRRSAGFTRREILSALGIADGGNFSRNLNALIASDFIIKYVPFGCSKNEVYYKLIDPFCIFYLHFVAEYNGTNERFWQQNTTSAAVNSWRGFAFENVCFNHISQIKRALGIESVISDSSAWSKRDGDEGTQIDLLIVRNDNVVNMCEIKFYGGDFKMNREYYLKILKRQLLLLERIPKKMSVQSTLITTFGLSSGEYSGVFNEVITLDDLFENR